MRSTYSFESFRNKWLFVFKLEMILLYPDKLTIFCGEKCTTISNDCPIVFKYWLSRKDSKCSFVGRSKTEKISCYL